MAKKKHPKGPARENPKAKERELQDSWQTLLSRHAAPLERGARSKGVKTFKIKRDNPRLPGPVVIRETPKINSIMTPGDSTAARPKQVYTGTAMVGIATMHKSNTVPIFNEEAAQDVAKMRRN